MLHELVQARFELVRARARHEANLNRALPRRIRAGGLFIARAGGKTDGMQYIADAKAKAEPGDPEHVPGAMARLGLDWPAVHARHPAIVYCSISGFGQTGPIAEHAAYDLVIQAAGGAMRSRMRPETVGCASPNL